MPGREATRRFEELVVKQGGEDVIFDRIAEGETVGAIMRSYGFQSRRVFYDWVRMNEERKRLFADARKLSAEALVEIGRSELDTVLDRIPEGVLRGSDVVGQARESAHFKRKIAEVTDRERFGPIGRQPQKNVTNVLNLGTLHLEALLAGQKTTVALPAATPEAEEPIEEAEYEVVESREPQENLDEPVTASVDDLWSEVN